VFSRVPSAGFEPAHTAPETDALTGSRAVKALFGRCTPFVYELFAGSGSASLSAQRP